MCQKQRQQLEADILELGWRIAGSLERENNGPEWSRKLIIDSRTLDWRNFKSKWEIPDHLPYVKPNFQRLRKLLKIVKRPWN